MRNTNHVAAADIDDIIWAPFPHEDAGHETLDKYTVRKWLIGHATLHGWRWKQINGLMGTLSNSGHTVSVLLVAAGLRLETTGELRNSVRVVGTKR